MCFYSPKENPDFSSTKTHPNEAKTWSYLIKKRISQGQGSLKQVLVIYTHIRSKGLYFFNLVPLVLKACASIANLDCGKVLHAESIKTGVYIDVMLGTSLVNAYAKCGHVMTSRKVFDEMPDRNVVTWNAMLGGYLRNGDKDSAKDLFEKMPRRSEVSWIEMIDGFARSGDTMTAKDLFDQVPFELKNVVTWTVMVDGYTSNGEMEAAKELFEEMPWRNFFVWSSMISGYCKRGDVKEAKAIFDRIPVRNLVNWNSLISGYAQNGLCEESLAAFGKMQAEGFEPDEVTVASVLSACAQLGMLEAGKKIHKMICHKGIKLNYYVLNSLVDMYAKCGDLVNARLIFERMGNRNNACWNAMISGFAIHGQSQEALEFFRRMENSNETPDDITFLSVLSACAHGGFVDEGLEAFSKMEKYNVAASVKHYGCLADLLGRAGRLKEAYDLIKSMPIRPNDIVWGALLGACRTHMDADMTELVMKEASILNTGKDSGGDTHYVLLSNIYAASDRWERAERMRMEMMEKGFQKTPGRSSVMFSNT
ncbi:PPR domain-containing protein/PPR_2 domain-containing protein [Cephalotus follicularis]|uniref:PPR domain-containing protein/PPR_2 domain-containing protein n=1 Tax=Cephalotus follicularis TaxID=3775 RepID=A0A1Q3ASB4_CEPFO|nr:PPR domain-containing protein/PPR_2 domain-containing protein [Cephalotus follicularis]